MLTDAAVAQALRTARRGTAAGLSGATCQHYKLLLLAHAANLLEAARRAAREGWLIGWEGLRCAVRGSGASGMATAT